MSWIALLFPAGALAALWPPLAQLGVARALLAVSLVPALTALGQGFSRVERRYCVLLALAVLGQLLAALGPLLLGEPLPPGRVTDITLDAARQVFLGLAGVLFVLQYRYRSVRRAVAGAFGAVALAMAAVLVVASLRFGGLLGGFRNLMAFKEYAVGVLGVDTNPLSFEAALAAGIAAPVWWNRRALRLLLLTVVGAGVLVSGSRTTQVTVLVAGALHVLLPRLAALRPGPRRALAAAAVLAAGVGVLGAALADALPDARGLSRLTTGRYALWEVAASRFAQHPVAGAGALSWRQGLAEELPTYVRAAFGVRAGGYHSGYLGALADKGLLGFLPALVLIAAVWRWSLTLRRGAAQLDGADAIFARLAPALVFALVLHAVGENAGFLGPANSTTDFAAYAVAGMVVALQRQREQECSGGPGIRVLPPRPGTGRPGAPIR